MFFVGEGGGVFLCGAGFFVGVLFETVCDEARHVLCREVREVVSVAAANLGE